MKTITRMITMKCGSCLGVGSLHVGFQMTCGVCKGSGEVTSYVEEIVEDELDETENAKREERGVEEIRFW
jgi:hypothetical protein